MFVLYQIIILLLILVSPIIIIYRIFKKKEDKKSLVEKFVLSTEQRVRGNLIWFHGASVGELMSILPLIKNYENNKSIDQILITSSTLSSSNIFNKFNFKKTVHQFYPIDQLFLTNKFLKYWRPCLAIFIESEIWPSMFRNLKNKNIPLILLNARITKKSFNKWIKIQNISKSIFDKITIAYPQNLETKSFLKKLNVKKINIIGNLKFTENPYKNSDQINFSLDSKLRKKKIWVASSTHRNEEKFCAKTHLELKKKYKNLITIIIPRHINRVKEIHDVLNKFNLKITYHSSRLRNLNNIDIYIVDTFGETRKFHKIANSVFLGGSLIKRGGQNPLEAARYGAKILHGPDTSNFKDVYKLLKSLNISEKINTPTQLAKSITFKKNKLSGAKIKKIGEKILKKTINELDKHINNELKKT